MGYSVEYAQSAIKDLKKLDKPTRQFVLAWIEKNLVGCSDPRQHGKGLTANHSGEWRYRVGNYRILAHILDKEVLILVLRAGHRSEIYKD